ncbi:hypothetical protein GCM10027082_34260 [Comamonas humi]
MKTASFLLSAAALASALSALPSAAQAASATFLNRTIAARIPAQDLPAFRTAVGNVLNSAADGSTTPWTSSQGPRRQPPVEVALTPLQTTQTRGGACRLLDAKVSQRSLSEQWQFWFCKQGDGSWKASSGGAR